MPDGEVSLQEPPAMAEPTNNSAAMWTFLPMGMMSMSMMVLFLRPGENTALSYVAMGMMVGSSAMMAVGQVIQRRGERKTQMNGQRRDYLRYLSQVRRRVRRAIGEQEQALAWRHPHPTALSGLVGTSRLWERRGVDEDFAEVRIAVGEQRLGLKMAPVSTRPVEDLEPLSAHALRSFIRAYTAVPDQPIALYLRAWSRLLVRGEAAESRALARAIVAQLAAFHSPDELWIALCLSEEAQREWEWAKWLPHLLHPQATDGAGPVRLVASSIGQLEDLIGAEFRERPAFDPTASPGREEPMVVVIVDGGSVPAGHRFDGSGYRNAVAVDLSQALRWRAGRTTLRLEAAEGYLNLVRTDRDRREQSTPLGVPDLLGPAGAAALARALAPYRTSTGGESVESPAGDIQLTGLLGISDLRAFDPATLWRGRSEARHLKVPIGVAGNGAPVDLDIKESAQGGMGPHGMLIGATGSGKSELLRTLVLSLALSHSSERLNFVLVDFKGGATFLGLDALPHVSAVITNLSDEAALVERMKDALHGELMRRQELLRQAGNHVSALEYERARAAGAPLMPLPSLFVVVDEFSELLSAHRDFMDLFVMIGRLGRSLGVHLLLASQRLDEGRVHQLEGHLSYRIGLRTFSAMESRGVLGVPDAYQLPPEPGNGYLKTGMEELLRFRAAYVSGTYKGRSRSAQRARAASQIVPWSSSWVVPRQSNVAEQPDPSEEPGSETLLELAVAALKDSGPPAYRVWLPPLAASPGLDQLLPPLEPHTVLGLVTVGRTAEPPLTAAVGIVDRPFDQTRELLRVDLSGAGGHVVVAGGPQSGKSTLLRTLVASLALGHSPRELQFYLLDLGGGTLSSLDGLPHVGGVAGRLDPDRVQRTVSEVTTVLTRRERLFMDHGVESMADYRRRRARGEFAAEDHGDVFLVIDGWASFKQDFDPLLEEIPKLAQRGLNYGVHVVVSVSRWMELSPAIRDSAGTRLELRMGDPMDSLVDSRKAATVPRDTPGRGLTSQTKLHFQAALPRIDSASGPEDLPEAVTALCEAVTLQWAGRPGAPAVRMLPAELPWQQLPAAAGTRLAIGVEETELGTLWHDFAESPHLMAIGDTESGKTNLLRTAALAITSRFTPAEARILVVDQRRELVEAVPPEYRLGHAVSAESVKEYVDGVAEAMRERTPGEDIPPARMRLCDWWTGPRLFVLIDDYEMLESPLDNPFNALLPHLNLGYEIGLHLVVARAAANAARGIGDPLLRRVRDAGNTVLVMSCPRSEGQFIDGVRPKLLPPGRAFHVQRRRITMVQTALAPTGS
ncbi:type VII secretion protein EccCa [Streptomyces sp. TLI_171]|uniref:type VII secretion protein EccCa n=1 Tax=Streptomyces sp. TLI_171 TaxID=1938859 RepID=UPI00217F0C65|nr:type VII secretion protein EccCa [Streptomyces sp. TLI_171]